MEDIGTWLPDYSKTKPESNNRYWLYLWVDVGLRLIEEFHTTLPQNLMEEGLAKLMKKSKFQLDTKDDDVLNSQFYKVDSVYKAIYKYLREQSSSYASSPMYVWSLLHRWLEEQKPVGPQFRRWINKAVNQLSTNPLAVFNTNHRLTRAEIERIKQLGPNGATERVYGLILDRLKTQALEGELHIECRTYSELADVQKQIEAAGKGGGGSGKKKQEKGVLSVSTDLSSITNNTTTDSGNKKKTNYPVCKWCRLFHNPTDAGKCPFWDEVKKVFRVKVFQFQGVNPAVIS
jgi:hypothetical protein